MHKETTRHLQQKYKICKATGKHKTMRRLTQDQRQGRPRQLRQTSTLHQTATHHMRREKEDRTYSSKKKVMRYRNLVNKSFREKKRLKGGGPNRTGQKDGREANSQESDFITGKKDHVISYISQSTS